MALTSFSTLPFCGMAALGHKRTHLVTQPMMLTWYPAQTRKLIGPISAADRVAAWMQEVLCGASGENVVHISGRSA